MFDATFYIKDFLTVMLHIMSMQEKPTWRWHFVAYTTCFFVNILFFFNLVIVFLITSPLLISTNLGSTK